MNGGHAFDLEAMDCGEPMLVVKSHNTKKQKVYLCLGVATVIAVSSVVAVVVLLATRGNDSPPPGPDQPPPTTESTPAPSTPIPSPTLGTQCPSAMLDIEQSILDENTYRVKRLSNCIKAILVSNPDTSLSYVGFNVGVGFLHDPVKLHGMGELVTNTLYKGSVKYPNGSTVAETAAKYNGGAYEWTTRDHTIYYMRVTPDGLQPMLEVFSDHIEQPLFANESVWETLTALDTQLQGRKEQDWARQFLLEVSTSNPNTPFSHFPYASIKVLGHPTLVDDVREYYNAKYTLDKFTVLIRSNHTFEQLEQFAEGAFGKLNRPATSPVAPWSEHPEQYPQAYPNGNNPTRDRTDKRYTGKIQYMKPAAGDIAQLYLKWPNEFGVQDKYPEDPTPLITYLFQQEMAGGIFAKLREEGLAIEMPFAGLYDPTDWFTTLGFVIELTTKGAKRTDDVLRVVYQYVGLMREQLRSAEGLKPWFDHAAILDDITWSFNPPKGVYDMSSKSYMLTRVSAARDVLMRPTHRVYDGKVLQQLIDNMTPENSIVTVLSKEVNVTLNLREKYFDTPYAEEDIPEAMRRRWMEPFTPELAMHLPPPPLFQYSVNEAVKGFEPPPPGRLEASTPKEITWDSDGSRFEGYQRPSYSTKPFTQFVVRLYRATPLPLTKGTAPSAPWAALEVFQAAFDLAVAEIAYPARKAAMQYGASMGLNHIDIKLSGVHLEQFYLLGELLQALRDPLGYRNNGTKGRESRFEFVRDQTLTRVERGKEVGATWGWSLKHGGQLALDAILEEITPVPMLSERVSVLRSLTKEDPSYANLSAEYTTGMCRGFLLGNVANPSGVLLAYQKRIAEAGFCRGDEPRVPSPPQSQVVKPEGWHVLQLPTHAIANTDAVATMVLLGELIVEVEAYCLLLKRFLPRHWSYDIMYNVGVLVGTNTSATADAAGMDEGLSADLTEIMQRIGNETDEAFNHTRDSAHSALLAKPDMSGELDMGWVEVVHGTHNWGRVDKLAEAMAGVSKGAMVGWAKEKLDLSTAARVSVEMFRASPPYPKVSSPWAKNTTRGGLKASFGTF